MTELTAEHVVAFIREHAAGAYGYGVQGEARAIMYAALADRVGKDTDDRLLAGAGNQLFASVDALLSTVHRAFETSVLDGGLDAWVGRDGTVIYVRSGYHLMLAEGGFGILEAEFEKDWAKVTRRTFSIKEAVRYVENPSRFQQDRVADVLDDIRERKNLHRVLL